MYVCTYTCSLCHVHVEVERLITVSALNDVVTSNGVLFFILLEHRMYNCICLLSEDRWMVAMELENKTWDDSTVMLCQNSQPEQPTCLVDIEYKSKLFMWKHMTQIPYRIFSCLKDSPWVSSLLFA